MRLLPLAVDVDGRRAVVVGGGAVGLRKVRTLLQHGAVVTVVDPEPAQPVSDLVGAAAVDLRHRAYDATDLEGAWLVVAATDDADVNSRVAADAARLGVLCVRGDGGGSAAFLATVARGDLLLAVSTGGRAPALAARIRAELEDAYGPEYGKLVEVLGDLRGDPEVRRRLEHLDGSQRAAVWRRILDTDILDHLRNNDLHLAREVASGCLSSSSD